MQETTQKKTTTLVSFLLQRTSAHKLHIDALTCFRVYGEVGLSLQDTVNYAGTIPIGRVICISSCHLQDRGTCAFRKTNFSGGNIQHKLCTQKKAILKYLWSRHILLNLIFGFIYQTIPCFFPMITNVPDERTTQNIWPPIF